MAAFFKISFSSRSLAFSRRSVPRSCSAVASSCLGTPLRSSSSKSRRHCATGYPNAQFTRHLGLGLVANGSQPHGLELELPVWCLRSLRSMTQTSAVIVPVWNCPRNVGNFNCGRPGAAIESLCQTIRRKSCVCDSCMSWKAGPAIARRRGASPIVNMNR